MRARRQAASPTAVSGSGVLLYERGDCPLGSDADSENGVVLAARHAGQSVAQKVAPDDLRRHFSDSPRIVEERTLNGGQGAGFPRMQETTSCPNSRPVFRNWPVRREDPSRWPPSQCKDQFRVCFTATQQIDTTSDDRCPAPLTAFSIDCLARCLPRSERQVHLGQLSRGSPRHRCVVCTYHAREPAWPAALRLLSAPANE